MRCRMKRDRSSLLRPVSRFPGEFFAIGLAFAIVTYIMAGSLAAMAVTALLGLVQVILLRRARLQGQQTTGRLAQAETEARHWQERAESFMSELSSYKDQVESRESRAAQAAATDPETGLGTLARLDVDFVRHAAESARSDEPFSVVLFQLRDAAHPDTALAPEVIAAAAQQLVRISGVEGVCRVARRGFAAMLDADQARATVFVERAQARFAQAPVVVNGRAVNISLSAGVAQFDGRMGQAREMLTMAARDLHARMQGSAANAA